MRCTECGTPTAQDQARCPDCQDANVPSSPFAEAPSRLARTPGILERGVAFASRCPVAGEGANAARSALAEVPSLSQLSRESTETAMGVEPADHDLHLPMTDSLEGPLAAAGDERSTRPQLTGRVISLNPHETDAPAMDVCLGLSRVLGLFMVLAAPLVVVRLSLALLSAGSPLVAFALIATAVIWCMPANLIALLRWVTGLDHASPPPVPVRYLRVRREDDGAEIELRLKGYLVRGSLNVDDRVSAWGRWRGGALLVNRAFNHRPRSRVRTRSGQSWPALLITAALAGGLILAVFAPTSLIVQGGTP